jgi:hypothetical protein
MAGVSNMVGIDKMARVYSMARVYNLAGVYKWPLVYGKFTRPQKGLLAKNDFLDESDFRRTTQMSFAHETVFRFIRKLPTKKLPVSKSVCRRNPILRNRPFGRLQMALKDCGMLS